MMTWIALCIVVLNTVVSLKFCHCRLHVSCILVCLLLLFFAHCCHFLMKWTCHFDSVFSSTTMSTSNAGDSKKNCWWLEPGPCNTVLIKFRGVVILCRWQFGDGKTEFSRVFNFAILSYSRKFDAREKYVFYTMMETALFLTHLGKY